jgi:hypothetical protein
MIGLVVIMAHKVEYSVYEEIQRHFILGVFELDCVVGHPVRADDYIPQ